MKKSDFDRKMRYVNWYESILGLKLYNYQKVLIFAMISEKMLRILGTIYAALPEPKD